jgi:hypothetical protein
MNFNLDTCKWVVWGFRHNWHTHTYVHAGFFRALQFLGKNARWMDEDDGSDFSNTLFLTENDVSLNLPRRKDCFYVNYNGGDQKCQKYLEGLKQLHFWCFYYENERQDRQKTPGDVELAVNTYFVPPNGLELQWATDLLPYEILALKPNRVFRSESKVINWVGTFEKNHNGNTVTPFADECKKNGIEFRTIGGYGEGYGKRFPKVTMEDNIKLIRESYIAPTIPAWCQMRGYAPCRIFKNISYGQYGVTTSKYVNSLFGNRLIFNESSSQLFYTAKELLPTIPLNDLHDLMDEVAEKHTYINRIKAIEQAARLSL